MIYVRRGEVRLRKMQVDLLHCTVTRDYGRVAYMHQFDMQQAGPHRAGLGRLARSVTNGLLYLCDVPHTTLSEQEQLCAALKSPCVTLIRFIL